MSLLLLHALTGPYSHVRDILQGGLELLHEGVRVRERILMSIHLEPIPSPWVRISCMRPCYEGEPHHGHA